MNTMIPAPAHLLAGEAATGTILPTPPVPLKEALKQTWMDALDVRELLHISRGTLHNLCKKGLLPYSQIGGRRYFDAADVQAMLVNARQVRSAK